mgnify:CR=1 FL=1
MLIRLDKYLADMQVGTRSEVKELIRKKRVTVNDNIVTKPESKINTDGDSVGYHEYEYFMLNKPAGVVSATDDNTCTTVIDLIKTNNRKDLFPVGRLDKDTEGLLLITNDGELAHRLLSPKKHVDKVYYVKVQGIVDEADQEIFAEGMSIGNGETALPSKLEILHSGEISEIRLTIQEGKFHQVKRMFHAVGKEVIYLKRLSMGTLLLDETLKSGEYRALTNEELKRLC